MSDRRNPLILTAVGLLLIVGGTVQITIRFKAADRQRQLA
jgi:hypothetical protein